MNYALFSATILNSEISQAIRAITLVYKEYREGKISFLLPIQHATEGQL